MPTTREKRIDSCLWIEFSLQVFPYNWRIAKMVALWYKQMVSSADKLAMVCDCRLVDRFTPSYRRNENERVSGLCSSLGSRF